MSHELTHPDYARGKAPSRRGPWKWRRLASVIAALAAAIVVAVFALQRSKRAPEPPVDDVPRREGDAIVVSESFREQAGIATTPAVRGQLTPLVRVVGNVEFDPTHVAAIGTRARGIVTDVKHVEGDIVLKGDVLALIESPSLADAQADLRIANANKRAAELNAEREIMLLERRLTTAREAEQAMAMLAQQQALESAAGERVEALGGGRKMGVSELRAPVSGVVAERAIAPGQSVGEGLVAFRVGDLDQLWVLLRVFQRHLDLVRPGDEVDIRPLSDRARVLDGQVAHVGAVLDPSTGTSNVRIELTDENRVLRPGQPVEATIHAGGGARVALSVPSSAITYVDGAPIVFVAEMPTRFVPRKVEPGIDGGDRVEITMGVAEGEAIVSASVLALKSELFR